MHKKKNLIDNLHIILGAILLCSALIVFSSNFTHSQEQKYYSEAGGEIVVIFDEQIGNSTLNHLTDEYGSSVDIVRYIGDYALLSVKDASEYDAVINRLEEDPQVLSAQANGEVDILSFSNDPYADSQWYIDNQGHYLNISGLTKNEKNTIEGIDMDVVEAWDLEESTFEKREVVVAVIDTGVDYSHPDLAKNMWVNKGEIDGDNIDNDNNGYVDDIYGWDFLNDDNTVCHYKYSKINDMKLASPEDNDDHGTHIAGIIGAVANNNIGIAGIASNIDVKIMSLKINGGRDGKGSISGAIEAIKYATMMGADICNLSWGTAQYTAGLKQVMKEADMLFVAAAGNTGDDNNNDPVYPASLQLDNLISVTFIDSRGELTGYSNYGTDSVDLAAPGEDIYSTIVGSYFSMSGSSMAAPQVSAVAAMLYAYGDNLYPANVKEILMSNIKPIPSLKGRTIYAGIPSAYLAVMASTDLTRDTDPPELSFETLYKKGEMTVPVYAKDLGDSKIRVIKWILGKNTLEDFRRGVNGTLVEKDQINVAKAGLYTFYAADYAGNETVQTYEILEDTIVPKITTTFTVAETYKSRTVTVKASDLQSGLKRVKYMTGIKKVQDFLPAGSGTEIELKDGKGTFKVKKDGTYTIFASDNRGNLTVQPIVIKTVKATEFRFVQSSKTLELREQYNLRTYVKPSSSTDRITYTSSNEKVAVITSSGKITALAKGKAYIIARTSSGLTAISIIIVK